MKPSPDSAEPTRSYGLTANSPGGYGGEELEAPVGFEPAVELLQSSALPLGHGAPKKTRENGAQGEI